MPQTPKEKRENEPEKSDACDKASWGEDQKKRGGPKKARSEGDPRELRGG